MPELDLVRVTLSLNLSVNILLNMFCSDLCEVMMCEIVCIK